MLSAVRRSPEIVKYVCLFLGMLSLLLLGVQHAMRQLFASAHQPGSRDQVASESAGDRQLLEAAPPDPARLRAQEILDKVTGQIRNEPTQSSRLLQSWIHSE